MRAEILAGKWTMLEKELSSEAQVFCTISSRLLALSSSCYSLLGHCAFFFPLHSTGLHSKYRSFLLPYTTLQKRVPEEHIKHIRWLVLGQNHVHEGNTAKRRESATIILWQNLFRSSIAKIQLQDTEALFSKACFKSFRVLSIII